LLLCHERFNEASLPEIVLHLLLNSLRIVYYHPGYF